ncbi:helix-turn-helix domain-containing protein [Streptomyces sp. NBC_00094]|uniref:helix-turn-helix domain-containing protein n=1 Tax=Streptomyces sp. NBC_00094 TaxID=2903620 RepID=UPI002259B85E|nr:helix-turn-helix domain-containing protein [Streptomyces sp. NBC_00094]MCX5391546.1 helix-turn-helix domain-containing protein [Streptomyces sp. NBC_00094]
MTTAMQPTVNRAMFTAEDAAAYLSLGRSTVYELMAAGDLPYVKVGRSRRIRLTELDAFVAQLKPHAN